MGTLLAACFFSAAHSGESMPSANSKVAAPGVLIIAHRGASAIAPENTLPAFTAALEARADLVELDYLHSADGVPVVFHDKDLDRTTDARAVFGEEKIRLDSKSLAELRRLDAGRWFNPSFAGTRIPTLAEALDTIQKGSLTLIERKAGDPATCVKLLAEKGLTDQVVVQAFDWDFLAGCHRLEPRLVLGALGDEPLTAQMLDAIARSGAQVVGWRDKDTDAGTIDAIHRRGWKAWVWTVDDPARAAVLVKAGVDGIITNRPAEIRRDVEAALSAR
jgi:glycerophosphoryl diester phosphodiesterase